MKRIGLFATGGTIAMGAAKDGGVAPRDGAAQLIAGLPLPEGIAIDQRNLFAKPSASVGLSDVQHIADTIAAGFADGLAGVVVTHGTDTLEETAFALALMLGPTSPVVITGAMRSADHTGADGPGNLVAALRVAAAPEADRQGPLIVFGDEIHAAHLARKVHSSRPHAFSSEPFGPLGHIVEDRVRFALRTRTDLPRLTLAGPPPVVPIVQVGLDLEEETVAMLEHPGIAAVVIAGVGGGHVSARSVSALERLARLKPVVITSRVGMGDALANSYAYAGGDIDLRRRGLINAGRWRPAQARILLQLALGRGRDAVTALFEE